MENQSRNQNPRRQRGNRSGGRNRGRNRNSNQQQAQGGQSSSSRSRRRKRQGGAPSSKSAGSAKPSFLQRLLSALSFGLLGRPAGKAKSKGKSRSPRRDRSPSPAKASAAGGSSPSERSRRSPQAADVTSARLYVGNLDYSTGEAELEELFRGVGNVISAEVVTNPRTQQSKGFAFVEMGSIDEAKRAVSVLDDQDFRGRRLVVSGARSESPEETPDAAAANR